jgi:tetraacyldisaccharide 4'-kinase
MREPAFWWRNAGLAAGLLAPLAAIYGAIAARRMAGPGARAALPVLCVGNFTLGGAGKTPTVMALATMLQQAGERPCCLSRGYGGSAAGPQLVDAHADRAAQVGDEALLLARVAPTIVARDRVAGAAAAAAAGASVVIMDDGLQNAALAKDFTLAVVDGRRGIGNACVFPAGPLRAPIAAQVARSDALLVVGESSGAGDVIAQAGARGIVGAARGLPVFHGRLVPDPAAVMALKARKVLAFAGIGDPEKFFATAVAAGIAIAQRRAFGDHHRYTAEQAAELIMQAEHDGLALLTTEKDRARMAGEPLLAALAAKAHVLPVTLVVEEVDELRRLVLAKARR